MVSREIPPTNHAGEQRRSRRLVVSVATVAFAVVLLHLAAEISPDAWFVATAVVVLHAYLMLSTHRPESRLRG